MQTLYTYNPNTATIEEWQLTNKSHNAIAFINTATGTKGTALVGDLQNFSNTKEEALKRYMDGYMGRIKEAQRQLDEVHNRQDKAVELFINQTF